MLVGREHRHVDADLGDDDFGCAPLNARDRAEQLNGFRERGDLFLDRVREPVDLLVKEVDVRENRADPQRMNVIEAALQRLPEGGELRAQATLREFGEQLGVGRAVHERVEHQASGLAEDVRRDGAGGLFRL